MRFLFLPIVVASRREFVERLAQLLVGLVLYGFALAMMIRGAIGVSPWDVLSLGLTNHVPIGFGTATVLISVVVLLLWIPLRQRPGIGTLLNALLVGPSAELGLWLLPPLPSLWLGVPAFLAGMVLLAFATGLYIAAEFGPGARDGLMTGLVRVTGWRIWIVRTIIEGTVLLAGFLLGGAVGVGTVLFAFGIGPLIGLFLPRISQWRGARSLRQASAERTGQPSGA